MRAEIEHAVQGRHPLIYCLTPEEDRVRDVLEVLASERGPEARVATWDCVNGLVPGTGSDTRDPCAALEAIVRDPQPGFHLMRDLPDHLHRADVVRALRNAYHALARDGQCTVVIVASVLEIPASLQKEIFLVEAALPSATELLEQVDRVRAAYPDAAVPDASRSAVALALRGLTLNEAGHVMHRVFSRGRVSDREIFEEIFAEKQWLLRKSGGLEFVPHPVDLDAIGGLDVLKDWVHARRELFTQEAVDQDLPIPRGMLIMGVSGCGKSLCAKAVASLWNIPLFRLDMNLVFSGLYGSPEAAFHRALRAVESVAPVVLWIDEIENALGMTSERATVDQSLTFSAFLTWMQERPPLVFVAATANRIESLPAEVIRKGRFDEVFFCDLPTDSERRAILRIHMERNGIDPEAVPPDRLLYATRGWTGAEIEQAVIAARIDAHNARRDATLDDLRHHIRRMVPLAATMAEQVKAIRDWSYERAMKASRDEPSAPGT